MRVLFALLPFAPAPLISPWSEEWFAKFATRNSAVSFNSIGSDEMAPTKIFTTGACCLPERQVRNEGPRLSWQSRWLP